MFTSKTIDRIEKAFKRVEADVTSRYKDVFDNASDIERICLKFYYAYMPVSDLATYDASLFLKIIRQTLKVHEMNIFGVDIPEDIFLNYVLHYRVNNENIEYNRELFFNELYHRIKDKTMYDAALEVNYWCLEKATYKASDPRTVSPLTLIRNAKGRCGEESTFTVTALRSVGIPARQIYTPRWAHCESNHAWVEAYVDGKWRFLGACEPEPALDRGWFTDPASRGMLIHTRVFSDIIYSDEEIIYGNEFFTELNLTSNYAETKKLVIKVINTDGKKVKVRCEVPNSCELSLIAVLETDGNGEVSFTTGLGDLQIHATDGERFLIHKVDVRKQDTVILDFNNAVLKETGSAAMKFVPPAGKAEDKDVPGDLSVHEARIQHCNEVRTAYENTFITEERGREIARGYAGFHAEIVRFLTESKGNYEEIIKFLDEDCGIPLKYKILLLKSLPEKDLTDSTCEMLKDHLVYAYPYRDCYYEDIFSQYVLNPRVLTEMLYPYRAFINSYFDEETKKAFQKDPRRIYDFINEEIQDVSETSYKSLIASAQGTLQLKKGSRVSRHVLFVSICRSLGIPARFNPVDRELEYYKDGEFVRLASQKPKETAKLMLKCEEKLRYARNFTIARLVDGEYQTLFLWRHETSEFDLEEGCYRVLTGQRLTDGSMLLNAYYVEIKKGNDLILEVSIPKETCQMERIALPDIKLSTQSGDIGLSSALYREFNILAYIEPSKEPTEHFLRELVQASETIKGRQVGVTLITAGRNHTLEEVLRVFPDIKLIETKNTAFAEELLSRLCLPSGSYPVQTMVQKTTKGMEALYYCSGYCVGSVDLMLKCM